MPQNSDPQCERQPSTAAAQSCLGPGCSTRTQPHISRAKHDETGRYAATRTTHCADLRCSLCWENLLIPDQPPPSPQGWERWFLQVIRQAIKADYLVHHDTPCAARSKRTHLVHASCHRSKHPPRADGKHRGAAEDLNRTSGLLGLSCAGTCMPGPEGA